MALKLNDSFGFFIDDFSLKVGSYIIEPVASHAAIVKKVLKQKNADGFFYPIQAGYKINPLTGKLRKIPNSEKPAHLYTLPATHIIYEKNDQELSDDFRYNDGALLIRLLAVLYDCRAQFHDLKYDTRFPLKQAMIVTSTRDELELLLNDVFNVFSTWSDEKQMRYNNILYLHSRCPAYEGEWEQFIMEYIVTDSLWNLFENLYLKTCLKARSKTCSIHAKAVHKERIKIMCNCLDVHYDKDEVENRIVKFRNELFHEGFWGEATPGFPQKNSEPFYSNLNLRKINLRLILAIAGVRSDFTKKNWNTFSA